MFVKAFFSVSIALLFSSCAKDTVPPTELQALLLSPANEKENHASTLFNRIEKRISHTNKNTKNEEEESPVLEELVETLPVEEKHTLLESFAERRHRLLLRGHHNRTSDCV